MPVAETPQTLATIETAPAVRLFAARAQTGSPISQLVARACRALQMERGDYEALTPLYALVFRYLKRNYGPGVRQHMDRLLLDLDQQGRKACAQG